MTPRQLPWIVAVLVSLTLFVFAWTGYPPPSSDAPAFLVSAINHSLGRGFVNTLYPQAAVADPSGHMRHVFGGPLFPLALAALMPWPTPQGAFLAIAALRGLSLLLCVLAFERLVAACGAPWRWPEAGFACASLCGLATHWVPSTGRPEALGTLFVLAAALVALRRPGTASPLSLGALAGTLAAAHPFGGVELMLAIGLLFATGHDTRRWALVWAVSAAAALAVFVVLLAASPHGLTDSLRGMLRAFPLTPWLVPPGADAWKAWTIARRTTFYGPLLLLSVSLGLRLLALHRRKLGSPVGAAFCLILLAGSFYFGSLTFRSLRNYNILLLAPLFFGIVLAWRCLPASRPGRPLLPALHAAAFLVVLATSVGFFGRLAALPTFLGEYRTLAQARAAWSRLELPPDGRVAILGNLWLLSEDYEHFELAPFGSEARLAERGLTVVLAQRPEHAGRAPELPGMRKLADFFNPARASRRGPLAHFLEEDYAFAVYVPR